MKQNNLQYISQMEQEIAKFFKKSFGKNLISLLVEGSYGTYDFIEGYSDYDLLVLVRNVKKSSKIDLVKLSKKYSIDIRFSVVSYADFQNRIKNNNKSSRFIGNFELIKIKKQSRLLAGKNVLKLIPPFKELVKRNLDCELRAEYYHATSSNPEWNIFKRGPRNWVSYIINMSNCLLLSNGIVVKKKDIPKMLQEYCPDFKGTACVKKALYLRRTKKVLGLNKQQKEKLKKMLDLFLEEYKNYTFN